MDWVGFVSTIVTILIAIAGIVGVIYCVCTGKKSVVMNMLYALVTEAEIEYGSGTGELKLATVISEIYPKLPTIIRMFITNAQLQKWVEEALTLAKEKWANNSNILQYIEAE